MLDVFPLNYSLIFPAFNEVRRIGKTLLEYHSGWKKRLPPIGKSYEFIVVANGCRDGTPMLVQMLRQGPLYGAPIRLLYLNVGNKGLAVLEGFRVARGQVVGFADADGAFSPEDVLQIMELAERGMVVIASKYAGGRRRASLPILRRIASWGWNALVHVLFGLRLADTQAGAKAMPAECAKAILDRVCPCGFAFDVSLLWEAHKAGYDIEEVPVEWKHLEGSKLSLIREVPKMFIALLRLRLQLFGKTELGKAVEISPQGELVPVSKLLS